MYKMKNIGRHRIPLSNAFRWGEVLSMGSVNNDNNNVGGNALHNKFGGLGGIYNVGGCIDKGPFQSVESFFQINF